MVKGTSFKERAEVKDIISYLRILVNDDDEEAFDRIVNIPKRGIGPATLSKIKEYKAKHKCTCLQALHELGRGRSMSRKVGDVMMVLYSLVRELQVNMKSFTLKELLDRLLTVTKYEKHLQTTCTNAQDQGTYHSYAMYMLFVTNMYIYLFIYVEQQ